MQRTSFIGREAEIGDVRKLIENQRLVTLTGVGGVGKTRLALQVGAEVLDVYPDGVFFIDLAPIVDADAIPRTLAEALGLPLTAEIGSGSPSPGATDERVLAHLASKKALLILDNCEHLLDPCAELADRILSHCPDATILATSREALDVEGEQSWRMPSLSLPEGDDAQRSEAVSLFKARAKAGKPDFELTPDSIDAVTEICRRLDGIPLAIELAASRVSHMSTQEIASRIGDMFSLLAGSRRRRVQRQQTLQAALDWSYDLLNDAERMLLRRLGVFAGSFTVQAVEGICAGEDLKARDVLDLLGSLVGKSLVTTEEIHGTTRYRLMETVRLYATEKLHEATEADTYRSRHGDWFEAWALSMPFESTRGSVHTVPDYANFVAALERAEDEGRMHTVIRMAVHLQGLWTGFGYFEAGHRWLSAARPEDLPLTPQERTAALAMLSYLSNMLRLPGGLELSERAIAAAGDEVSPWLARAIINRAVNRAILSEATSDSELAAAARRDRDEAARIATELSLGAEGYSAAALGAMIDMILGDYHGAYAGLERATTDEIALTNFGFLPAAAHLVEAHEVAAEAARRELEEFRSMDVKGYTLRPGTHVEYLAAHAVALAGAGQDGEARDVLAGSLEAVRAERPGSLELSIIGFAAIAHLAGDHPRASRLLAWARSRTLDRGRNLTHGGIYALYKHYVRLVRDALGPDEGRRYRAEGAAMSEEEVIACALQGV